MRRADSLGWPAIQSKVAEQMQQKRLNLYHIDTSYVEELHKVDRRVMSTSPAEGKSNRPFVGVVVPCKGREYCIPLSSPKPKHEHMKSDRDFSKIVDRRGKLIGVLNFNNMVPVNSDVLAPVDSLVRHGDAPDVRAYKELLNNQLDWCNDNAELIHRKSEKLYRIVTESPEKMRALTRRCCDFKSLEKVLDGWRCSS